MKEIKGIHIEEIDELNCTISLDKKTYITGYDDDAIYFSDGLSIHDVDNRCRGCTYADWSLLDYYKKEFNKPFDQIKIKLVEGLGFLLNGILINCYSQDTEYYSNDLSLSIRLNSIEIYSIDISECSNEVD